MKGLLRMTVNKAKAELREYRVLLKRLAYLHQRHVSIGMSLGMMKFKAANGARNNGLAQRICRAEEKEGAVAREEEYSLRRSEKLRRIIDRRLSALSELDRKILSEKYYKGRTLISISIELCYEYTWLCKLHKQALENYSKIK